MMQDLPEIAETKINELKAVRGEATLPGPEDARPRDVGGAVENAAASGACPA